MRILNFKNKILIMTAECILLSYLFPYYLSGQSENILFDYRGEVRYYDIQVDNLSAKPRYFTLKTDRPVFTIIHLVNNGEIIPTRLIDTPNNKLFAEIKNDGEMKKYYYISFETKIGMKDGKLSLRVATSSGLSLVQVWCSPISDDHFQLVEVKINEVER